MPGLSVRRGSPQAVLGAVRFVCDLQFYCEMGRAGNPRHVGVGPLLLHSGQSRVCDWLESDGRAVPAAVGNRAKDRFTLYQGDRFALNENERELIGGMGWVLNA